MRFTISDGSGERIVIHDSTDGQRYGYHLAKDGVKGWFGSPQVRESVTAGVGHDGDFWPPSMTQGARTVTVTGYVLADSTMELAREVDRIDGLAGKRLTIACEDAHGTRTATGYLSDDPDPTVYPSEQEAGFSLVITCPDPHRYGPWVAYEGGGTVANHGNAASWPRVHAEGDPLTRLTLSCGSQSVEWSGSADSLDLDLSDLSVATGTLSQDNAFQVPPGGVRVTVSTAGTSATATVYGRDAWR